MSAIVFDTLKFVRHLKEAGVSEKHAEAEAEALVEAFDSTVVTKADLLEVLAPIKERLVNIEGDMRLVKWMLALVIIVTVIPVLKSMIN